MRVPTVALCTITALASQQLTFQAIALGLPVGALASGGAPLVDTQRPPVLLANAVTSQQLTDVQGHWAQNFIIPLVERDIMEGFPDGTFRPDAPVNRAEFAIIIQKAFQNSRDRVAPEFADVPTNSGAYSAIRAAYEMGFLGKYPNNLFRPEQQISRVQVLVALVQGLKLSSKAAALTDIDSAFEDAATIPDYARNSVAIALANGILVKNSNVPQLYPNQVATRADVAALIYQASIVTQNRPQQPVATQPTLPQLSPAPSNQTQPAQVPPPPPVQPTPPSAPQELPQNFATVSAVSEAYTLGAGDRVRLDNLTAPEYNGETLVLADGSLSLPLIGKVSVRGMTLEQAANVISNQYNYYIREPVVSVSLVTPRPLKVAIAGEVIRPGSYSIPLAESAQFPTITQALKLAGGTTQTAELRQVLVRRPQEFADDQIIAINLWNLLQGADLSQDLVLRDGDSIFIPTANYSNPTESAEIASASFAADTSQPLKIVVVGEVSRPGTHTVSSTATGTEGRGGLPTVTDALQVAGGITQSADLRQIQIRRATKAGSEQIINVNLWQLLQQGDRSQDVILQQGDTIVVATATYNNPADSALIAAASFAADSAKPINVAIVGEVGRPGPYTVINEATSNDGSGGPPTVTKAIQVAGGITQSADIRQIQVRRLTRAGSEQLIDVDLWQLLQTGDRGQDILLQQGDTIVIPTATSLTAAESTEIAAASFSPDKISINVVGEVIRAGSVQVPPNTPLNQALLAAGGFNNRARKASVELIRLNPNGTVTQRKVEVDLDQSINEQTNPVLRNNDVIVVDRSNLAKVSDTVGSVVNPIGSVFSIFNFFRLFR